MLEKLIQILLVDRYLLITSEVARIIQAYPVYVLRLYREKSQWLIEAFDLNDERKRIIPVDQVTDVVLNPDKKD